MSKPFEWKDFSKRYNDLATNNFPSVNRKTNHLENVLKFKFSSKAQNGIKLDSSATQKDHTTESEFSTKLTFEDIKGVELGVKAKSRPGAEVTVRLDDSIIPVEGSSFTLKSVATHPSEQNVGGIFGFSNKLINLNFGVFLPITKRFLEFLSTKKEDLEKLENQRTKVDLDFVVKPLEDRDFYIGAEVKTQLPREQDPLLYTSNINLGLNNKTTNAGIFINHEKTEEENKETKQKEHRHSTSVGGWVYTEVDDLSGGAKVSYTPSKHNEPYGGFSFEVISGLRRDADSKLTSKVTVIPHTTLSLGLEQKVSSSTKFTFGYAFLLNKAQENQPSSTYNFGIEISH